MQIHLQEWEGMDKCQHYSELKNCGLRKTKDRHDILELFDQERAWTVEQVHKELPQMDLSTIYRNIKKLVENDLLAEVPSRFAGQLYGRKTDKHHDHAVCTVCGVVRCIACPIKKIDNHFLEIIETCPHCR